MARVTGPFFSLEASGTLGKTLTAAKWKGRPYIRQRVIPLNPKSAKQLGVRAALAFLANEWADLTAGTKDDYDENATAKQISPFNEYCSVNLLRHQQNKGPSQAYPAAEASAALTITTMTCTGYAGYATVAITPSGATAIWGYLIYRHTAEITTPNWANCVAMVAANGATPVVFTDSPLAAATYHYRVAAFNVDGIVGTVKADATAAVT